MHAEPPVGPAETESPSKCDIVLVGLVKASDGTSAFSVHPIQRF